MERANNNQTRADRCFRPEIVTQAPRPFYDYISLIPERESIYTVPYVYVRVWCKGARDEVYHGRRV